MSGGDGITVATLGGDAVRAVIPELARLRATRVQLLDMYSPVAKRAGT